MSCEKSAKRSRVMESTSTTLSETGCDDATLFASGIERLHAAQKELVLAQKNMKDIRHDIRSRGNYEPDSLLRLCNGDDNHHILSHIMKYMPIEDVGRCEIVCSTLKQQAKHYWDMKLNDANINNHPTRRSLSATCSRDAVIRYQLASTLAKGIGDMKDSISKHLVVQTRDSYRHTISDERVYDHCEGCEFPDLNFDPLRRETRDQYELFVRFCRTGDNTLLAEGFLPCTSEMDEVTLQLRSMDCSNWPQFSELAGLIETCEGDTFADNPQYNRMLDDCMKELTVVVVGVHKLTYKASLVVAQSNFGDSPSTMHGIDNMGGHGFCVPRGSMLVKSHGNLELKELDTSTNPLLQDHSLTQYHTRYCTAELLMKFDSHVWTSESGEEIKKECHWELGCSCDTYQKDY